MPKSKYTKGLEIGPGKNMPSNPSYSGVGARVGHHKGTGGNVYGKARGSENRNNTSNGKKSSSNLSSVIGHAQDVVNQLVDKGLKFLYF